MKLLKPKQLYIILAIILSNKLHSQSLFFKADRMLKDTIFVKESNQNTLLEIGFEIRGTDKEIKLKITDEHTGTAQFKKDYDYADFPKLPIILTTNKANKHKVKLNIKLIPDTEKEDSEYVKIKIAWPDLLMEEEEKDTILIVCILDEKSKNKKVGDLSNYLKTEIVQYSDFVGIKNDKPNGLLQFQGLIKIPINKKKHLVSNKWSYQFFRSVIIDGTINRIDKSKEEVDYNYTTFLYGSNNTAAITKNPWLATTDIWRFSNLHAGLRIVPLALDLGNFRIHFQAGIKLIKNLPFTQDSVRSGPDSGKVKSDFRSVFSNSKYLEVFIKTIENDQKISASLNFGAMWLKLTDSYYEQINIYQQDPFQKAVALAPVEKRGYKNNRPIWFTSLRIGMELGTDKVVNTFIRLNYLVQSGNYNKALDQVVDGKPVRFETKKFYNNYFQVQFGTTFEINKLFNKSDKKKDDGPVSNSL
jgi:hypothetical protein